MSGFNTDVVSILKHCNMCNTSSYGAVLGGTDAKAGKDVYDYLSKLGLRVANGYMRQIKMWDYIIIPRKHSSVRRLVEAITSLNSLGIIIIETTGVDAKIEERYNSVDSVLSATKVVYEDRSYLVVHTGNEYGN